MVPTKYAHSNSVPTDVAFVRIVYMTSEIALLIFRRIVATASVMKELCVVSVLFVSVSGVVVLHREELSCILASSHTMMIGIATVGTFESIISSVFDLCKPMPQVDLKEIVALSSFR